MRKSVLIVLLLLMISSLSCASYYFVILNVSPIKLEPNSETNFTVSVKGLGSQGGYVQLVFRNLSQGLSVPKAGGTRYVLSLGNRTYNCTMRAGSIEPGNYSFDVGIYAFGAKSAWKKAYVAVLPLAGMPQAAANQSLNKTVVALPPAVQGQAASEESTERPNRAQAAPGPGIAAAMVALLLLSWLGRRTRPCQSLACQPLLGMNWSCALGRKHKSKMEAKRHSAVLKHDLRSWWLDVQRRRPSSASISLRSL